MIEGCGLCPRECKVDRAHGERGYCGMPKEPYVARASLHQWEEPCISGTEGSGTVFFSGCTLRCVFCQNYRIAKDISFMQHLNKYDLLRLDMQLIRSTAINEGCQEQLHAYLQKKVIGELRQD